MDVLSWLVIILISLAGAVGGVFLKHGTAQFGEIQLKQFFDVKWSIKYLFTPAIFFGLFLLFIGRFLMGSPLSKGSLGRVTTIITTMTIFFTVIAGMILFKESYGLKAYIGLALAVVSIILIGSE